MDKYRMRFSKTGRAVYISHLDLMRTITRAFLRAECRLKYSEGFNPHPNISIALPLSVGCESVCEIMDFKMLEDMPCDEIKSRLSTQMPEGIEVSRSMRLSARSRRSSGCAFLAFSSMTSATQQQWPKSSMSFTLPTALL